MLDKLCSQLRRISIPFYFRLNFIFTFTIFIIILVTLVLTTLIVYIQVKAGILEATFYQNPLSELIFIFMLSLIIGTITTIIGSRMSLKFTSQFLAAMKDLANGNFDVRVRMTGRIRPKELVDFSDQFNDMAKELGSIEMLRSDFVNNFSHEFKTPIVSLRGFAKLLKADNLTPTEREEYLDIMISESERLSALATNVLNLSKIENQTIITEKSIFNLSEQIRRSILLMESKWSEKELDLEVDLDETSLYGNAELLNQAWINVVDNAVKFSSQGGKIKIKLSDSIDSILFKVEDYGLGMDANTQSHMFDKFYQGDTSHATEGNGLGMALVNKIISLHHGFISVKSTPNQGTQIMITLPKRKEKNPNH